VQLKDVSTETAILQAQFIQFSGKLDAAKKSLSAMTEAGVTSERAFASQRSIIEELEPVVAVLGDHFRDVAAGMNAAAAEAKIFDAEFEAAIQGEEENIKQADAALKEFTKAWPKLRDELDPVGAAMREQQANIDTFTTALRFGKITAEEFQQALDDLALGGPESEDVDTADNDLEKEKAAERLAMMDENNATAEENLAIHMGNNLQIIQDGLDAEIISEADAADRRLDIVERFQKAKARLESRQFIKGLSDAGRFFTGMMNLTQSSSKGLFNVMKAGALASAVVNTFAAVNKAMAEVPYPYNIAAAGAALAAGLGNVASIRSTSFGGGGGGGSAPSGGGGGGGGSAPTSVATPDLTSANAPSTSITINLGDEEGLISKSTFRRLIDGINEELADGAVIGSIGVA